MYLPLNELKLLIRNHLVSNLFCSFKLKIICHSSVTLSVIILAHEYLSFSFYWEGLGGYIQHFQMYACRKSLTNFIT